MMIDDLSFRLDVFGLYCCCRPFTGLLYRTGTNLPNYLVYNTGQVLHWYLTVVIHRTISILPLIFVIFLK